MRWTPSDLSDLTGRRVIVTGANSGIGFHAARELAAHGATVTLACRSVERAEEAAGRIGGAVTVSQLNLSSQQSIADFAERWEGPLDLLINNAGVMDPPVYKQTEDGHELMFGTNHLGHFALTGRLLPALLAGTSPRVVTISSIAHHGGDEGVLDANPEATYKPHKGYQQSKLANLLFSKELQRRFGDRVASTAAHPGVSATELVRNPEGMGANWVLNNIGTPFMKMAFQSAARGADPTLFAATIAEPGSYTGPTWLRETRGPIGPAKESRWARDVDLAGRLWDLSVEKTGVSFPPSNVQ